MRHPRVSAPEISNRHGWLNTGRSLRLHDFRGKVVLLDFWTLGCINCHHILPDLERLEREYPNELAIIGIHSGKFDTEKSTSAIQQAILKLGIKHPVVNDADFHVWRQYAVNAWPTVVLIDPEGKVVGQKAGEGVYGQVKIHIDQLLQEFADKIDRTPLDLTPEVQPESELRFPSKLIPGAGDTIWLSDSGHNRILQLDQQGQILQQIGSGSQGLDNGSFAEATFNEPHGLALAGDMLYIADSRNHAIRRANLVTKTVDTVAGTGEMGWYGGSDKKDVPVLPNSPWDLAADGEYLYVANAGNHQILRMSLSGHQLFRFAGSGLENLVDGPFFDASFNQPSGIALHDRSLFVADPEASAIREIELESGEVKTLLGRSLFDFGDVDGPAEDALLQHAVGVCWHEGALYIADSYNGNVKRYDPGQKTVTTLVTGLIEPNGLAFSGGKLWVTSTNEHKLMKVDLEKGEMEEVPVSVDLPQ